MLMRVSLPWPSSILSPNARPHFQKLARAKKVARADAAWGAKAAGLSERGALTAGAMRAIRDRQDAADAVALWDYVQSINSRAHQMVSVGGLLGGGR